MKPMLAATYDPQTTNLIFPVIATPKIDGIRCVTTVGPGMLKNEWCVPLTRSLKPIPNAHIRQQVAERCHPGLDGELIVGDNFQQTSSAVMSRGGNPTFTYHVFDLYGSNLYGSSKGYEGRLNDLKGLSLPPFCRLVESRLCSNRACLEQFMDECLEKGYEGICFRTPNSPYKHGRSTVREQWLMKWKKFEDGEAIITGFEERLHNANAPTQNELGFTERSTHRAGMQGTDSLGSFSVLDCKTDEEFNVGTGFTEDERRSFWEVREELIGRIIKYRHQPHGRKDAPRIPSFLGFRDEGDM